MTERTYPDTELLYAATSRCKCGAGLAYPIDSEQAMKFGAWVCSRVLNGGATGEHESFLWAFYKVRAETSVNNDGGRTTRPAGTVAMTVCKATCQKCLHTWESEPYSACGAGHHFAGDCPSCGYGVGGNGIYKTGDGKRIDARYHDVVIEWKP